MFKQIASIKRVLLLSCCVIIYSCTNIPVEQVRQYEVNKLRRIVDNNDEAKIVVFTFSKRLKREEVIIYLNGINICPLYAGKQYIDERSGDWEYQVVIIDDIQLGVIEVGKKQFRFTIKKDSFNRHWFVELYYSDSDGALSLYSADAARIGYI